MVIYDFVFNLYLYIKKQTTRKPFTAFFSLAHYGNQQTIKNTCCCPQRADDQ